MNIKWYGHSCFLITTDGGTRIVTDPYDGSIGYNKLELSADIVTISHGHHDHNAIGTVSGNPKVCANEGVFEFEGVRVTGIKSYHDEQKGALRGENLIFLIEAEGMRLAHMGDLGCIPEGEALSLITPIDIALIPIGTVYTIGPREACELANILNARVMIPMHYQTPSLKLSKKLLGVEELINIAKDCKIHRLNESECIITVDNLGEDRLVVLDYVR